MDKTTQRQYNSKWRKSHLDACRNRDYLYNRSIDGKYSGLRYAAKCAQVPMTLTFSEFEVLNSLPCHYCGGQLTEASYGLGQIIPGEGYTPENARPCCKRCNTAKLDMTEDEFAEWSSRLYQQWSSKYK